MCVWGGGTPNCFKLGPNEKCVKGMQVRRCEEAHHIHLTWVNSCREAGFSRVPNNKLTLVVPKRP